MMSIVNPPEELNLGPPRHGGQHSRAVLIVVTVVALIAGAACGYLFRSVTQHSTTTTTATPTVTRTSSASPSTSSPSNAATTPAGMGFEPHTAPVDKPPTGHVVFFGAKAWHNVGHDGLEQDMVDLGFTGGAPACVASYVPARISAPTSKDLPDAAFLQVRCPGVSGITPTDEVLGPTSDVPPTKNVMGLVRTGYRDHVLTWTIALPVKTPMAVALILADLNWVEIVIMS